MWFCLLDGCEVFEVLGAWVLDLEGNFEDQRRNVVVLIDGARPMEFRYHIDNNMHGGQTRGKEGRREREPEVIYQLRNRRDAVLKRKSCPHHTLLYS